MKNIEITIRRPRGEVRIISAEVDAGAVVLRETTEYDGEPGDYYAMEIPPEASAQIAAFMLAVDREYREHVPHQPELPLGVAA